MNYITDKEKQILADKLFFFLIPEGSRSVDVENFRDDILDSLPSDVAFDTIDMILKEEIEKGNIVFINDMYYPLEEDIVPYKYIIENNINAQMEGSFGPIRLGLVKAKIVNHSFFRDLNGKDRMEISQLFDQILNEKIKKGEITLREGLLVGDEYEYLIPTLSEIEELFFDNESLIITDLMNLYLSTFYNGGSISSHEQKIFVSYIEHLVSIGKLKQNLLHILNPRKNKKREYEEDHDLESISKRIREQRLFDL